MAKIIKALTGPARIPYHLYGVVDVEEEWRVHDLDPRANGWVDTGPNAVALAPAGLDDDVLIRYELWDAEPTTPPWAESYSASVRLTSGRICAVSGYGGESECHDEFDLGVPDQVWRLRAHRMALHHEDFTPELVRVTLFKLQFWPPADAVRPSPE